MVALGWRPGGAHSPWGASASRLDAHACPHVCARARVCVRARVRARARARARMRVCTSALHTHVPGARGGSVRRSDQGDQIKEIRSDLV